MKEYHNIDLYIRDKLKQYPSNVDVDIWDKIDIIPPKTYQIGNPFGLAFLFICMLFIGKSNYLNFESGNINSVQKKIPLFVLNQDKDLQNSNLSNLESVSIQNRQPTIVGNIETMDVEIQLKSKKELTDQIKLVRRTNSPPPITKQLSNRITELDVNVRDIDISSLLPPDVSDCYDPNKKTYVFADAYYSPMYSLKKLNDRTNENANFLSLRENSESYVYGHAFGIRGGVINESGLIIAAGVEASQWIEKFVYENENEVQITTVDVYDGGGNLIRTDTSIAYGSRIKTTYNKLSFIDIPFSVGYVSRGRTMDLYGMIGANLNFIFAQKGEILSQGNTIGSIDSNDPWALSVFKKNAGISPHLAVGASYHLDNDLDLFVETHIKTNLSSFTLSDYPLEQKHYTAALRLGIRKEIY